MDGLNGELSFYFSSKLKDRLMLLALVITFRDV